VFERYGAFRNRKNKETKLNAINSSDKIDGSVPPSEQGKGENMPLDRRTPSAFFGLVGLTYFVVLLLVLTGAAIWQFCF